MPKISLPIDSYIEEIKNSFAQKNNLILTAPPGSGKTTRVPAALAEKFKQIIVLVPKRIAAISAANRIAEENNWTLGKEVGYQIRFENVTSQDTRIIFMTEGVFIKKLQDQTMWNSLDLIIFDEFHERSSNLDISLGFAFEKQILEQKIKLLIMSATLDASALQKYLDDVNLINVKNSPHPLEIIKNKKSQKLQIDHQFADLLTEAVQMAMSKTKRDILIFLPGLSEIRFIERQLQDKFRTFEFKILHSSIKLEEQKSILQESGKRRIILATNIAESSVTIPSVDCVIDSGLEKKSVTENKIGFKRLELSRISLFSAHQRAGRAARTGPGVCIQLWHEIDERSMPEKIQPEILSSQLLEECLTLLSLNISNPDQFSWLDKPKKSFSEIIEQLDKWGLVNSDKGKLVQKIPLDLERSLLFVELSLLGFQKEASRLSAFLETTNFDKLTEQIDLDQLRLNDLGHKIEAQLNRIHIGNNPRTTGSFKDNLIAVFFKNFPNKIAKKKEKNLAVSSLGRGIELTPSLLQTSSDYFLLLSGRELTNAITKCDCTISFTTQEFEKYSKSHTEQHILYDIDSEKRKIFKTEKKMAGLFVVSESAKSYIDEKQNPEIFKRLFREKFSDLIQHHSHYKNYVTKLNFLKKKTAHDFYFLNIFEEEVYKAVSDSANSIEDFFSLNLFEIMLFFTPEEIKKDLISLPDNFTLPNGKIIPIDYESEQAPKVSARIQEFFGQHTNPTVMNGKIKLTIELLAPNYRPAQITSHLEQFWKTSYLEIKKELKARYPKHAWPDDPLNYKAEPKKR